MRYAPPMLAIVLSSIYRNIFMIFIFMHVSIRDLFPYSKVLCFCKYYDHLNKFLN